MPKVQCGWFMNTGSIFEIKRFATHDGPGIRTTIFLKGCGLQCWWCHNPESQHRAPSVMYRADRCIGCGTCIESCPRGALVLSPEGVRTDWKLCGRCGTCIGSCPADARVSTGWTVDIEHLMRIIEEDVPFYDQSGGGVTFSGGEPLSQPEFLIALLKECGRLGIHCAVDTCGFAELDTVRRVSGYTDLFLYDLKLIDPARHKKFTGVSNERILENLKWLSANGAEVYIRIPLVPGINDDKEDIEQIVLFVTGLARRHPVCLLPYHGAASHKYASLGFEYRLKEVSPPSPEKLSEIIDRLSGAGVDAQIGG